VPGLPLTDLIKYLCASFPNGPDSESTTMFDQSGVEAVTAPPAPPRLSVTVALPPPRNASAPAVIESLHGPP
jgi:hypothetical protein